MAVSAAVWEADTNERRKHTVSACVRDTGGGVGAGVRQGPRSHNREEVRTEIIAQQHMQDVRLHFEHLKSLTPSLAGDCAHLARGVGIRVGGRVQ